MEEVGNWLIWISSYPLNLPYPGVRRDGRQIPGTRQSQNYLPYYQS